MITNITLENFKCFRKVEVEPRRITAFVGPNGTGKSSVLQALALLKQSMGGQEQFNLQGSLVNLNRYDQIQPKFDEKQTQRIAFQGVYDPSPIEAKDFGEHLSFDYDAHIIEGRTPQQGTRSVVKQEPLLIPREVLGNLKFVSAARGFGQPTYGQSHQVHEDIQLSGNLNQQEQYAASNLFYSNRQIKSKIAHWSKKVTGIEIVADPIPAQLVEIKSLAPSGDINIVAEGFGTNALILLFLQLASAEKGATVLIEEPEIHLHPKAQAELASVLVEEAQSEDKQIIMTTHSEHILGRLLTLVAERQLAVDELAIYAFEKDEKGECTASQLEVTEDGRVVGGIKDFFESDLDSPSYEPWLYSPIRERGIQLAPRGDRHRVTGRRSPFTICAGNCSYKSWRCQHRC